MAQLVITYWRDIPSMIEVRQGRREKAKRLLPERFQEAIDRAAMRAGASDTDSYLAQWRKAPAVPCGDDLEAEADRIMAEIDAAWDDEKLRLLVAASGQADTVQ
ncbi:MAG: virulence factor [Rhodospirillales bacterium]